jgi:hypothetical protein
MSGPGHFIPFLSAVNMFISLFKTVYGERDIALCFFNLKLYVQLETRFADLKWTVFSVVCSVLFCDLLLLSYCFSSVQCTVHFSCIVLCLLVMYVLLP